jgi:D-3-phosphoglycerate dehydrogenase
MEILVTEPEYFNKSVIDELKKIGKVKIVRNKEMLAKEITNADVLVVRIETKIDRQILEHTSKLKIIASATTALNHIDTDFAKEKGIKILNLNGANTISTAEHTIALMLSLSRKIPWAHNSLNKGIWKRHKFIGSQLHGKTLGIIGFGRIGRQVAERAKAFGMNIIAYDPYVKTNDVKMIGIEELIKDSDVITLHTELTKENEQMLSHDQFKNMKKNAILINAARSRLVDSTALLEALKSKMIAGAAIDVFDNEPLKDKNDPLITYSKKNKNLLLTPHIAASTNEAAHDAGMEIARLIKEQMIA